MGRNDELVQSILDMPEEKAKDLLAEILLSYAEKGYGIGNGDERFLNTVKTIYMRLVLDKYKL